MTDIDLLLRDNIRKLVPYASARDEFSGTANIFLDANENSLGSPIRDQYNRYPDPHQVKIKELVSGIKGVPARNIFLGNGSDECIDLLYRAFCNPGLDNTIINPPTYGMYEVSAHINNVEVRRAMLTADFQPDLEKMASLVDQHTKIIWICSPNNPTGNAFHHQIIEMILNNFDGLVVIDEAYINFSRQQSFIRELTEYPNLVVMQTLSKAWGLAGLRVGMAFASEAIVEVLNRIKPPYNIAQPTQELALKALAETDRVNEMIRDLVALRDKLAAEITQLPAVERVYPSDANFLLVKIDRAQEVYRQLLNRGIVVRDRSRVALCDDCLRITVGKKEENDALLSALRTME
ncbi:MAG: histidinol-phosphate transaminase [Bacteroidota bacterium]|nr:histidinol-phosphate transaminase [Bacteroidota bacterium]MDP4211913.1 histidinol-phosphate transaminase [Bacteroidota bacterium]MDP4249282.1 histidinol-phosphate transaminase [Bacteroidota bacterium]